MQRVIRGRLKAVRSSPGKKQQVPPLRYALSKNTSRKGGRPLKPKKEGLNGPPKALVAGGRNRRSLGFARDDKERATVGLKVIAG